MSISGSEPIPDEPEQLPPARRRRERRLIAPLDAGERAEFLDELAHQSSPTFDFYIFSLLAGVIIGAGLLFNSPAIIVMGAISAPFMAPVIGISLATILGSGKFFSRTFLGFLIGGVLVLISGIIIGWIARSWHPFVFNQVYFHTVLTWQDILIVVFGSVLIVYRFVRSDHKPVLIGVLISYELYVPLSTAGFGIGNGLPHLFPDGLVVFGVYLAVAILCGIITLVILGFRPLTLFGYTLGSTIALVSLILLIGLSGAGAAFQTQVALPTAPPSNTPPPSFTPKPSPTATMTGIPTHTAIPTKTATRTLSPSPTPVSAVIRANEKGGVRVRNKPGYDGAVLVTLNVNTPVLIYSDSVELEDETWVHIRTVDGKIEGWCVLTLLKTATPITGTPTLTPKPGIGS
jgi:uncharacterized membrane protein